MKKLLLLTLSLFLFFGAYAQLPNNPAERTVISKQSGKWSEVTTWTMPTNWKGSCRTPGCSGTYSDTGAAIDWSIFTIIIKQTHTVEVWDTRTVGNFILVEGATYDAADNVIVEGGKLGFVKKEGGGQGRLVLLWESYVLLEKGSDIYSTSETGTNTNQSDAANHLDFIGPNGELARLNGKRINEVQTPAQMSWSVGGCAAGGSCPPPPIIPQPVDVLSYNLKAQGTDVLAEWVASSEINFSHYEVEWSLDGKEFFAAGSVSARGTEAGAQRYSFVHKPGQNGTLYYRLLGVDIDGTIADKGVRVIRIGNEVFNAYAKQGRVHVNYNGPAESLITIYDTSGRLIKADKLSAEGIEVVGTQPGMYLVQISNSLEKKTQRVVIN